MFYKQHMIKKTTWTFFDFIQSLLSFIEKMDSLTVDYVPASNLGMAQMVMVNLDMEILGNYDMYRTN